MADPLSHFDHVMNAGRQLMIEGNRVLGKTLLLLVGKSSVPLQRMILRTWLFETTRASLEDGSRRKKVCALKRSAVVLDEWVERTTFSFWLKMTEMAGLQMYAERIMNKMLWLFDGKARNRFLKEALFMEWIDNIHRARMGNKSDMTLNKAIMRWGAESELVLRRATFTAWFHYNQESKNDAMIGKVFYLLCGDGNSKVVYTTFFNAWADVKRRCRTDRGSALILGKVLMRWDKESRELMLQTYFLAWSNAVAEAIMGKKHGEVLGKTLMTWGCESDVLKLQTTWKCWDRARKEAVLNKSHEAMVGKVLLMLCGEGSSKIVLQTTFLGWQQESAKYWADRKKGAVIDKTLLAWGVESELLSKRNAWHLWSQVHEENLALRRYKEAMKKQNKDFTQILGKSMMRWGVQSDSLCLTTTFTSWRQLLELKVLERSKEALVGKVLLIAFGDGNSKMVGQVVFGAWEELSKRIRMDQKSTEVMGKTLLAWGKESAQVLQTTYFLAWMRECREAMHIRNVKKQHGTLDKALLRWNAENREVLLGVVFREWSSETQKSLLMNKGLVAFDGSKSVIQHTVLHQWHKHVLQVVADRKFRDANLGFTQLLGKSLMRWGVQSDSLILTTTFCSWKQVLEMKVMERSKEALVGKVLLIAFGEGNSKMLLQIVFGGWYEDSKRGKLDSKNTEVMGKTLLAWGKESDQVLQLTYFMSWMRFCRESSVERAIQKGQSTMDKALLRWNSESKEILLGVVAKEWHTEADRAKKERKHGDVIAKTLLKWNSESKALVQRSTVLGWRKIAHLSAADKKSGNVLSKALLRWDSENSRILLDATFQAWRELYKEAKVYRANEEFLKRTLLQMGAASDAVLVDLLFGAWRDLWKQGVAYRDHEQFLQKTLLKWGVESKKVLVDMVFSGWRETAKEAWQFRDHEEFLTRMLLRWGAESDSGLLSVTFAAWMKDTHLTLQQRALHGKRNHAVDSTLMVWAAENARWSLTMAIQAWSRVSKTSSLNRRSHSTIGSVLGRYTKSGEMVLLRTCFSSWQDLWRETASDRKALKKFARKDAVITRAILEWEAESTAVLLSRVLLTWIAWYSAERRNIEAIMAARRDKMMLRAVEAMCKNKKQYELKSILQAWLVESRVTSRAAEMVDSLGSLATLLLGSEQKGQQYSMEHDLKNSIADSIDSHTSACDTKLDILLEDLEHLAAEVAQMPRAKIPTTPASLRRSVPDPALRAPGQLPVNGLHKDPDDLAAAETGSMLSSPQLSMISPSESASQRQSVSYTAPLMGSIRVLPSSRPSSRPPSVQPRRDFVSPSTPSLTPSSTPRMAPMGMDSIIPNIIQPGRPSPFMPSSMGVTSDRRSLTPQRGMMTPRTAMSRSMVNPPGGLAFNSVGSMSTPRLHVGSFY
eukprot:TRINITY_DN6321_c0_g1_i1.p1 TRINITY_DN6321_c0_g1~~TRINITY_DN6321_c0_g1_i1.p1  ORF type:complete len:1393 (-),score=389.44 TRINITY_DN6321_c0_g1_i1:164-4342(-)